MNYMINTLYVNQYIRSYTVYREDKEKNDTGLLLSV